MLVRLQLVVLVAVLIGLLCGFGDQRCAAQPEPKLPDSEISALKGIAAKLKIGSDLWSFSLDPCEWPKKKGNETADITKNLTCTCNETTDVCHVVGLELKSTNLTGELPDEEFANLTHLAVLDLTRNYINGTIPTTWAKLPLVHISILGNRLSGEIPEEIGSISTLEDLVLESNSLGGRIPASLGNLGNLKRLHLSANNFVGELPDSLGKLTNLTDFRIDGTRISGKFPSFIGNWTKLTRLDMQGTSLEGPFPATLSALTKLKQLRVSDFKGDGRFPPLENMSSLKYLILRNCSISGPIPDYLGTLSSKLKFLDLSFNNFTGEIPQTFQNLSNNVDYMFLTNNMLNGEIPEWIFDNDKIDLSYNYFTGPDKGSCQISDVNLVSSHQSSKSNKTLYCLKNLPCSMEARNYQLFINCGGPAVDVNGTKYESDYDPRGISDFFLSGKENWAYSSTGDFTFFSGRSKFLKANTSALKTNNPLYLTARASASSLKYYGLCLQAGSYTVKLHFAEIIFTDDQTYSSLGRRFFDVAIQGKKVLENFDIVEEANGTGREIIMPFNASVNNTLEIEFLWSGKGTNAIPAKGNYGPLISAISVIPNFEPVPESVHSKGLFALAISGIVFGCILVVCLIILSWRILLHRRERSSEGIFHVQSTLHRADGLSSKLQFCLFQKKKKFQGAFFSFGEIKAATKNFHPNNKIGEGGFGPVYKGQLQDGCVVAVKKLSSKSKQGNREFMNEIGMLSALQHPHLVKLFGCCNEGNQLLLIYEYMENNSLARALFAPEEARLNLDWGRRRKVSLDIARGLAYIHEESRFQIIHRDIKATNVLLDKHLSAKISDFGLAKLRDEENTHISTRIAGTLGYMAPEYAMRGHLTEKADVYSFGVVMLEIVSRKRNTDHRVQNEFPCLLDWANFLLRQGKLLELVDPCLGSNYSETEAEQMLTLALVCTNSLYTRRPTMTSVIRMMEEQTPVDALMKLSHIAEVQNEFQCFDGHTLDSILCLEEYTFDSNGICPDGRSSDVK